MKAVPILVVTNALALGLLILLFVQQNDLKDQINTNRSDRREVGSINDPGMQDRIARLERLLRARERGEDRVSAELPGSAKLDPGGEATATTSDGPPVEGIEDGEPVYEPREMNVFRKKVRKAIELNQEEDRVKRVVDRLDSLIGDNKIAPLNQKQKESVAQTVLATRREIPNIWRRLRESGSLQETSREDRARIIRVEYENLRTEAQKQIEEVVPAADAKTIIEDSMADRGMWRGFGGDGGTQRRRSGR